MQVPLKETFQLLTFPVTELYRREDGTAKYLQMRTEGKRVEEKQGTEILLQKNHSSVGWEILPLKSHMLWNVQGEIALVGS